MRFVKIVASVINVLLIVAAIGGAGWLLLDWREQKNQVYALRTAVLSQNKTITMKDQTITAYAEAVSTWKDRYEQLRWQQRISPPNQYRKGVR